MLLRVCIVVALAFGSIVWSQELVAGQVAVGGMYIDQGSLTYTEVSFTAVRMSFGPSLSLGSLMPVALSTQTGPQQSVATFHPCPPVRIVVVQVAKGDKDSRYYHLPGCPYCPRARRAIGVWEAEEQGLTPCPYCLKCGPEPTLDQLREKCEFMCNWKKGGW